MVGFFFILTLGLVYEWLKGGVISSIDKYADD